MSEPDVVAELDAWVVNCPEPSLIRRARDEIVAMRGAWPEALRLARSEAFEEVAQIMDLHSDKIITGTFLAWAIRALKERDDERAGRDRGAE